MVDDGASPSDFKTPPAAKGDKKLEFFVGGMAKLMNPKPKVQQIEVSPPRNKKDVKVTQRVPTYKASRSKEKLPRILAK